MLTSLLIIALITAGGFALTYLFEREEPLMWRIAAGNVIGSAIFGTVTFVIAMFVGLGTPTVIAAIVITFVPTALILKGERKRSFDHDLAKAKGKLQGANLKKSLPFFYYAGFLILFILFFDRAMIENAQGIFSGGSNNLGDLPFHLGAIFSFADGANFPPQNPNFAGSKFSYPFIADLIAAGSLKFGIGVRDAMLVQNVVWAFSLLVLLERFVYRLVGGKSAAKLAPPLLFFSGGLGFIWFFGDFGAQGGGFVEFLKHLPKDYTIGEDFRWGNSLITLFLTQRSLLLGMPITLIVLGFLWRTFNSQHKGEKDSLGQLLPNIIVGLIAGLLPLIHLHSLAVLFVVTGFLLLLRFDRWKEFVAFGIGVGVMAIPELIWSMSGSATHASEFFAWHFGFDARETNIVWFWIKNTGMLFPLIGAGIYLANTAKQSEPGHDKKHGKDKKEHIEFKGKELALFYLPFVFLFVLANVAKLAPWEWDNIKVLIYWFLGSIPFVVFALAWMWNKSTSIKTAAWICFAVLIVSGVIDVWRTVSGQINYRVFEPDAVVIADRLKASTPPNALFLNAPTYNTAIVLSGRRSLMRYPGHLSSHGIDYRQREDDVKQIYRGGPNAVTLMEKYGIEYVLISPEERANLGPNEAFFTRYPVAAEAGQFKVYKIK